MIRENNISLNKTYVYTYNDGTNLTVDNNNIKTKTVYSVCTWGTGTPSGTATSAAYTYSTVYFDRLNNYNGQVNTYNSFGNPTKYRSTTTNMTWQGRLLTSYTKNSIANTYTYDYNGIRQSKTSGSLTTMYLYSGNKLISEQNANYTIWYLYDQNGLIGFEISGTVNGTYYYVRNQQGDVVMVVSATGTVMASYSYNAWGEYAITANVSDIANINPIRYRGYYYDKETGLYSVGLRYYDPEVGRWISPDDVNIAIDAGQFNLYAYCDNDPINRVDPTGYAWWHWAIGAGVVVACVALTIVTAGGFAAGMMAMGAAASGTVLAGASVVTTIAAFASVGAGAALAASAIVASIDAAVSWGQTGSFDAGLQTAMDYGETAMWSTVGGAVVGGFGGYASYKEQNPKITHSWTTERNRYWKTHGGNSNGEVLHHPYGRSGAGFYTYYPMSPSSHIQFHKTYGYKNFGTYPYTNFWEIVRKLFGGM